MPYGTGAAGAALPATGIALVNPKLGIIVGGVMLVGAAFMRIGRRRRPVEV